jgi:serine/threonine protein kinase
MVYEGISIKDNEPVAIKFEKRNKEDLLMKEASFLFDLKGFGIPKIISLGKNNIYNILVEELLGLSLYHLWDFKKQKDMKIKNVCLIALQALNRLEFIHSKHIIHGDIKPTNFLIGRKNKEIIYIIDFGLAHKYRSSKTGKHIKYKNLKSFSGSIFFSSLNANKGYEQSRRDDLESLGYMLVYLALNYLPWSNFFFNTTLNPESKTKKLSCLKSSITPESLCKGLPEEFASFIKYCRKLEFEKDPDYDYLKSLFKNILSRNPLKNELFFFGQLRDL